MRVVLLSLFTSLFYASFSQTLSPCAPLQAHHIVVLGSSTAAGAGASAQDSAWVWRYRHYLQSLNANNQVTNLAVGGYNTYKLMPTDYVPPFNRPDPDTRRNITAAIQLMPDAIIVNLPSNDVAAGYTVAEQLANFDTIVTHANSAGIPTWICTTQPRNFSAGQVAMQEEVRDSIWAKYGPHVLDFWTPVADTNGWILPIYNSGDGTHLNDAGHRLLFEEVVSVALPDSLFEPLPYINVTVKSAMDPSAPCGADPSIIEVVVTNLGLGFSNSWIGQLGVSPPFGPARLFTDTTGGLAMCAIDTLHFAVNTSAPGHYTFFYSHSVTGDPQALDDTIGWSTTYLGLPSVAEMDDTICSGEFATLTASSFLADSIAWYDEAGGTIPLDWGNTVQFGPVNRPDTLYAQAVRGPLHYASSILTTDQSNVNWNGTMFDLIAQTDLSIDSFDLKVADVGQRAVSIYVKPGSHLGFETMPGAWTLLGHDTMNVTDPNAFVMAVLPIPYPVQSGDTIGVYLEMQDPNVRLSYRNTGSTFQRSNAEISILTGSGSNHNFGGLYFPRDWNGSVYYHYGYNPLGTCHSNRIPVVVEVDIPKPDIGSDTTIKLNETIQLAAGNQFTNFQWSTGQSTRSISVSGSVLGLGTHLVTLTATNKFGCTVADTLEITVEHGVGIDKTVDPQFTLFPNPAEGEVRLQTSKHIIRLSFTMYNPEGQMVPVQYAETGDGDWWITLPEVASGLYWIRITADGINRSLPLVISK